MSIYQGKKAASNIAAFNAAAKPGEETVRKLSGTLQNRDFGEKHFATAHDFCKSARDAAIIKIAHTLDYNSNSKLEDRSLDSFLFYMGIVKDKDGETHYNDYIPAISSMKMRRDFFTFTSRALPLIFSSQHTEFRFNQRNKDAAILDYQSEDSQWSILTALVMATTLPKVMTEKGELTLPVSIPHADGFYLGHATGCGVKSFYPNDYVVAARRDKDGKPFLHGIGTKDEKIITAPVWSPQSHIRITTFIGNRDLHHDQAELYAMFGDVFRDPRTLRAYSATMISYTNLMPNTAAETADINWVIGQFEKIYQSSIWNSVNRYGQRHLPKHDLN